MKKRLTFYSHKPITKEFLKNLGFDVLNDVKIESEELDESDSLFKEKDENILTAIKEMKNSGGLKYKHVYTFKDVNCPLKAMVLFTRIRNAEKNEILKEVS